MARWIYGFESRGSRSLSDQELRELRRVALRASLVTRLVAVASVLLGGISLISIAVLASEPRFAFPVFIALVVAFLWLFSRVNPCEAKTLLYRRAIREGQVEIFEKSVVPDQVRLLVGKDKWADEEDDEPGKSGAANDYWLKEEKFLSQLQKEVGQMPQTIEAIGRDGVILLVQGKVIQRVIASPLITLSD